MNIDFPFIIIHEFGPGFSKNHTASVQASQVQQAELVFKLFNQHTHNYFSFSFPPRLGDVSSNSVTGVVVIGTCLVKTARVEVIGTCLVKTAAVFPSWMVNE
jgi:hypothetical protein